MNGEGVKGKVERKEGGMVDRRILLVGEYTCTETGTLLLEPIKVSAQGYKCRRSLY